MYPIKFRYQYTFDKLKDQYYYYITVITRDDVGIQYKGLTFHKYKWTKYGISQYLTNYLY